MCLLLSPGAGGQAVILNLQACAGQGGVSLRAGLIFSSVTLCCCPRPSCVYFKLYRNFVSWIQYSPPALYQLYWHVTWVAYDSATEV